MAEAQAVRDMASDPNPYLEQIHEERPLGNRWLADVWLVRTAFGQWDRILDAAAPDADRSYARGAWNYARGSALAAEGQHEAAEQQLSALASDSTFM